MAKSKMMSILKRLKNLIIGKHNRRKTIENADAPVNERQKLWWINEVNYTTIKRLTMGQRFEIYL